jgi:flagellin
MRELTVQASNDTNVTADRQAIAEEVRALTKEIDRIAAQTEFNTMKLLSGGISNKVLQVGANSNQLITFSISAMTTANLSVTSTATANVISGASAGTTITPVVSIVNTAITKVSTQRSKLGALQNRLEHTITNADNTAENLQAAESRIRDVDMAKEMVQYSKNNILQQAAQSMLAQANQSTQGVLSLLQ